MLPAIRTNKKNSSGTLEWLYNSCQVSIFRECSKSTKSREIYVPAINGQQKHKFLCSRSFQSICKIFEIFGFVLTCSDLLDFNLESFQIWNPSQKLGIHKSKKHGVKDSIRRFIAPGCVCCLVCLIYLRTRERLLNHM